MKAVHAHGETVGAHRFERVGEDPILRVDVFRCERCALLACARVTRGAGAYAARYYSTDQVEPRRWFLVSIKLPCRAGAYA